MSNAVLYAKKSQEWISKNQTVINYLLLNTKWHVV